MASRLWKTAVGWRDQRRWCKGVRQRSRNKTIYRSNTGGQHPSGHILTRKNKMVKADSLHASVRLQSKSCAFGNVLVSWSWVFSPHWFLCSCHFKFVFQFAFQLLVYVSLWCILVFILFFVCVVGMRIDFSKNAAIPIPLWISLIDSIPYWLSLGSHWLLFGSHHFAMIVFVPCALCLVLLPLCH